MELDDPVDIGVFPEFSQLRDSTWGGQSRWVKLYCTQREILPPYLAQVQHFVRRHDASPS